MYYVKTETPDYTITTSYATKYQAEKYGSVAKTGDLHLMKGDFYDLVDAPECNEAGDFEDMGRVRTVFRTGRTVADGKFMLYASDVDDAGNEFWNYTGISFQEYKDANRFLKSPSLRSYGDMLVVENPNVKQSWKADGEASSIDFSSPLTAGVYDL